LIVTPYTKLPTPSRRHVPSFVSSLTPRCITFPHPHTRIIHQQADASELHPLRLSVFRERLHVEFQYQVCQHELQRVGCEEAAGAMNRMSAQAHLQADKQRQHDINSPSMLPQSKGHIFSRYLHSADLAFVRHQCLRRLLTPSGSYLTIPERPERIPILVLAGETRPLHQPRVQSNMRALRQIRSIRRVETCGRDDFA
jgi:hypothetical protein